MLFCDPTPCGTGSDSSEFITNYEYSEPSRFFSHGHCDLECSERKSRDLVTISPVTTWKQLDFYQKQEARCRQSKTASQIKKQKQHFYRSFLCETATKQLKGACHRRVLTLLIIHEVWCTSCVCTSLSMPC